MIAKSQSGFRKGQSTADNLTNLTLNIEESFSKNKDVFAVFLQVCGAFGNVTISLLITKLAEIGCPKNLVHLIHFITHERIVYTDNSGNQPRFVCKGVPQGGILSPLLYCIYVNLVVENLPKSVKVSQFADDIALYCQRYPLTTNKRQLEQSVAIVADNLKKLGLNRKNIKLIKSHEHYKILKRHPLGC